MSLSSVKQQEIIFRGRETEKERREKGGGGAGGEKGSLHHISIGKRKLSLILLWPPVVLVTVQQLDVDKLQIRIAIATLSWLLMQSQDCGHHVRAHTIQLSVMTCPPTLSNCQ